jgi:hypothetical protein
VGLNEQFQIDNADKGIVVIEVLQSAETGADLDAWTLLTGFHLMRTEPADLIESAVTGATTYPIALVIDVQTMEIVADCYEDWKVLGVMEYTDMLEVCFTLNTEITF